MTISFMPSSEQYFSTLNYSLANEDTALELALLKEGAGHVVCVAGSGGRAMPLLAKKPTRLTCVDLSEAQLHLTELRMEAVRALSNEEYVSFFGYLPNPATPGQRKTLFARIRPRLSEGARASFEKSFEQAQWDSLLYAGRWERTFAKLAKLNQALTGAAGAGVFECRTMEEQRRYLEERFPWRRFRWVLRLAGNAAVFNALLYGGHFPKKNIAESMPRFYEGAYRRLFARGLARANFFLQISFFGRIRYPEANPVECDFQVLNAAREALKCCTVEYRSGDFLQGHAADPLVDFFSVSDAVSYLAGEQEKGYLQALRSRMAPRGLVIARYYLRVCEGLDLSGFEEVAAQYQAPIEAEKVQMYRVAVYRKKD